MVQICLFHVIILNLAIIFECFVIIIFLYEVFIILTFQNDDLNVLYVLLNKIIVFDSI